MRTRQPIRKKKPYGPNIVRAWFDTVFHFALRGLESERRFLIRGNWTFRYYNRSLEYLGAVAEHLPEGGRENLEQLVSFFPEVEDRIHEHDDRVHALQQDCRTYCEAILEHPVFIDTFRSVTAGAADAIIPAESDFMGFLAEYLVNNIEALPPYHNLAEFWGLYRARFLQVLSTAEVAPLYERTGQRGKAMLEALDDLISSLKDTRSGLASEFDVPIVAELRSVR